MSAKHPWEYHPALTQERLITIAELLRDVYYKTEVDLSTPLDWGYTRGTTTFGRQHRALILLWQSKKHPWFEILNAAMDLVFAFEGVPIRFFSDDPKSPKKPGYYRRNDVDQLFSDDVGMPVILRFVVEKPLTDEDDVSVYFLGHNCLEEEVFRWKYAAEPAHVLHAVGGEPPAAVEQQPAEVDLPEDVPTTKNGSTET
ncbi:hypothetical protein HA051_08205 [Chromobacterium vaccinii]|nr:hypothetical protein [Chromobacterium vaccinii]